MTDIKIMTPLESLYNIISYDTDIDRKESKKILSNNLFKSLNDNKTSMVQILNEPDNITKVLLMIANSYNTKLYINYPDIGILNENRSIFKQYNNYLQYSVCVELDNFIEVVKNLNNKIGFIHIKDKSESLILDTLMKLYPYFNTTKCFVLLDPTNAEFSVQWLTQQKWKTVFENKVDKLILLEN